MLVHVTNSQSDKLPVGLIAHLVEHCTSIAEVMGSYRPFKALSSSQIFFRILFHNCLSCVYNCDGQYCRHIVELLSSTSCKPI